MNKISLCVDSGNTRLKIRAIPIGMDEATHNTITRIDELTINNNELDKLNEFIQNLQEKQIHIQHVYIVSVASAVLRQQVEKIFSPIDIDYVDKHEKIVGLTSLYDIEQLGHDRWFGLLGAYCHHMGSANNEHHPALLHVSFGTATTIDTIYEKKVMGGLILPGLELMATSLLQGTAQLPKVGFPTPHLSDFPSNTREAIQGGIINAQVGAVVQSIQKIWQYYNVLPVLYCSGGARAAVMPSLYRAVVGVGGDDGAGWGAGSGSGSGNGEPIVITEIDNPVLDGMAFHVRSSQNLKG